jgi:hypothetical protein
MMEIHDQNRVVVWTERMDEEEYVIKYVYWVMTRLLLHLAQIFNKAAVTSRAFVRLGLKALTLLIPFFLFSHNGHSINNKASGFSLTVEAFYTKTKPLKKAQEDDSRLLLRLALEMPKY